MENFQEGRLFFIKDEFFDIVNECYLKLNKDVTQRPHYYAFEDKETGLFWCIPCSAQIEKYVKIIQNKIANKKPHNHIQIIKVSGIEQAFLYQDMFPISEQFVSNVYKNKYGYFEIKDPKKRENIKKNALKIIKLIRHGVCFTPTQPDICKIEKMLLESFVYEEVATTKEKNFKED